MAGKNKVVLTFAGDATKLQRTLKSVQGQTSRLGRSLSVASKGMAGLGTAASSLQVVAGAAGALAQLSGAALLLPGAMLAGGAAVATFKAATAGFADAVAGDTDALNDLQPAARDTAKAIHSLAPAWSAVQNGVQQDFFRGFGDDVRKLGATYLPALRMQMGNVAMAMNAMGRSAVQALIKPSAVNDVNEVFRATHLMLARMTDSLGNVASGFLGLGAVGATYLPGLGAGIDSVAAKFKAWVDQGVESGWITDIIDDALAGFRALGGIIVNVGSTIGSVFSGLGVNTASPLEALRDVTGALAEFAASSDAQTAFAAIGEALAAAGSLVRSVFIEALKAVAPVLAIVAPVVTDFARALESILVPALQAAAPALRFVADFLVDTLPVWGPVVAAVYAISAATKGWAIAQGLLNTVVAMNPLVLIGIAVVALVAGIVYAWKNCETFRNVVTAVWEGIKSAFTTGVEWVKGLLNWFAELPGRAATWFGGMKDTAVAAFTALTTWLSELPGRILEFFLALPGQVAFALGYLAGLVYVGALKAWSFLTDTLPGVIGQAITWLMGLPGRVLGALSSLASTVMGIATRAWAGFTSSTSSGITAAITWVSALPGRIGAFMARLPGILLSAAVAAWTGFRNTTVSMANATASWIGTLPGRIMGFFRGAGSWLVNAGRSIVTGLWNGLKGMAQAVLDWIAGLGRRIADGFKAAVGIRSPSRVFAQFGEYLGQGLIVGMEGISPKVVTSAGDMAGAAMAGAAGISGSVTGGAAGGSGALELRVAPGADSALAALLHGMVRRGELQLMRA
ncbi:MAG: hypothetical protein JNM77_08750 [Pseudonocardia sp.]|nr:hypothetical protein [Pseudonocardia sp.]